MINTLTPADTSVVGDPSETTGSAGSQSTLYQKPLPRKLKEERFRKQLIERQTNQAPAQLTDFLVNTVRHLRTLDGETRKQQARDIGTFFQYYNCNEYGNFNDAGEWIADDQNSEEFAYSMPLVPPHVDAAKTLLSKVNLEFDYKPKNEVATLDAQLSRMCETLAEEEMERIMTNDLKALERLYLLLAGKSFRCHFWAGNSLDPATVEIPVYEVEEVEVPGSRVCGNQECGTPLEQTDELCPKCLSSEIVTTEAGKTGVTKSTQQTVTLAENQLYIPNPLAIQHDLSKRNINKTFLIERDAPSRSEAEYLYCQTIPTGTAGITQETRIVRELERARLRTDSGNQAYSWMDSHPFANDAEVVQRERLWLEPWRYSNFVISELHWYISPTDGLIWCENENEKPDAEAKRVKPGTRLGDIFPTGMFLCVLVDDVIVEIGASQVSDKWIKLIFGMLPASVDGSGLRRLRPLADMANDSTNLEFKVLMDDADPKTFLNRKYLSHLARVGEYNIVDQLKDGESWEHVVKRLEGAAAHPALGIFGDRVNAAAQFTVGTFSSIGAGAPDVKASGTATGVVKMAEEAAGRFVEAIQQIAFADIESRYKVLKNIQRFSLPPQIEELKKRFGSQVVQRFEACNLRQTVKVTTKKGTDQPQSQAITMALLQAYGEAAAQLANNPQGMSILESFAEIVGLPITVGIGLADKEEAKRRIGLMREITQPLNEQKLNPEEVATIVAEVIEDVIKQSEFELPLPQPEPQMDPMTGEPIPPQPPPVPAVIMMQDHVVFMDAYKDFLLTEGARCNNAVLNMSVQTMWKLHYERDIIKQNEIVSIEARKQANAQMIAAPPMPPEPPHPSPEEMAEAERASAEEGMERELMAEGLKREADEQSKEAEFERSERAKDAELERKALEMEIQHENAKDFEQSKPKPEAKSAGKGDG